jgi:hypothetical protein
MATRPVFVPNRSKSAYVLEIPVEFHWVAGMAVSQKQKSIASLHKSARERLAGTRILEISSKSTEPLGVSLSAFNLMLTLGGRRVSVEVAFQAGKQFEKGGPFVDLLEGSSRDAKADMRLRESGRLVGFVLDDVKWPLEPLTAFYDWIYLHALAENPRMAEGLDGYGAFTDIEFNPQKSLNCQARSAALYVSLKRERLLETALASKEAYLTLLGYGTSETVQTRLL